MAAAPSIVFLALCAAAGLGLSADASGQSPCSGGDDAACRAGGDDASTLQLHAVGEHNRTARQPTGCAGGQYVGNTGTGTMDVVSTTERNFWCTKEPAKTQLQNLKDGVGQGSFCGWKVGHSVTYVCGTCLKVTCDGHVGHAAVVDSNEVDANQFMDVHGEAGFWASVCPRVHAPDLCHCDWEVVEPCGCYNA